MKFPPQSISYGYSVLVNSLIELSLTRLYCFNNLIWDQKVPKVFHVIIDPVLN